MTEIRSLIEQLVAAGVDPVDAAEVVTRAVLHGAANAPKQRTAGAVRQERYRRNKASQVTNSDAPLDKENPQTPKEINPPRSDPKGSSLTPRAELEIVLDAERAKAVLDHRQRIRKPLTAHAAKLLAGKFAKVADPNAAADAMIANGWQGFEPQWLENRGSVHQQTTAPPPKPRTVAELAIHRLRTGDFRNDDSSNSDRFLGAGDGAGQDQSSRILELAAIAAHGRR